MDTPGPTTLPKGILTNSSTVYDEVAAYSTLPADKLHQYWHVYTTTNKKLKDPTARRLENFWWHVWGSDRSKLSGPVLARIFEDISVGPTVVPLRGPPNRWEGPDAAPLTVEMIMAHIQRNLHNNSRSNPALTRRRNERAAARVSSSSALRPSQPPPILKKAGSSSTSITRHTATARFVSPHESAEEDDVESDIPSSGSTLANGFNIPTRTVANTTKTDAKSSRSPTTTTGLASTSSTTKDQPTCNGTAALQARQTRNDGQPAASSSDTSGRRSSRTTRNFDNLTQTVCREASKSPVRDKPATGKQKATRHSRPKAASDHGELSMTKPAHSLLTAATSSVSNVDAQGTIIDQAGSIPSLPQLSTSNFPRDESSSHGGSSTSSLREARLTPTQPSSSAVLPLGRTKSQLTLLLEREKERSRN